MYYFKRFLIVMLIVSSFTLSASAHAQTATAFTYQGELVRGGLRVTDTCTFIFTLFDAATNGNVVGTPVNRAGVTVANGMFTVMLDFGADVFTGSARWLNIQVQCSGDAAPEQLAPRQPVTAAPHAIYAAQAGRVPWSGVTGVPADLAGWRLAGNSGLNGAMHYLGTTDNVTLTLKVSDTVAMRYIPGADGGTPNVLGGAGSNTVAATVEGASIGGGAQNTALAVYVTAAGGFSNTVSGEVAVVGGGAFNTASGEGATVAGGGYNTANGEGATIGGGVNNTTSSPSTTVAGGGFNTASGDGATVGGGAGNTASGLSATIAGGGFNTADASSATVGGGGYNSASGDGATIGGGVENAASSLSATIAGGSYNQASAGGATVAGGIENSASGEAAAVGGGISNTASGLAATVSGGYTNTVSGAGATVAGGGFNMASGLAATVSGGYTNTASGIGAVAAGGGGNLAGGDYSFAAGSSARAIHTGAFVWADSTASAFSSGAIDQVAIRASGGVSVVTSADGSTGVFLAAGGSGWNVISDRDVKTNLTPVDPQQLLEAVAALPISHWNYRTQDSSIRHIGPMAQDFAAAFGVGENDTTINSVDADGVSLAAIQGLYQQLQYQRQVIAGQQATIIAQQQMLDALAQRVAALEAADVRTR